MTRRGVNAIIGCLVLHIKSRDSSSSVRRGATSVNNARLSKSSAPLFSPPSTISCITPPTNPRKCPPEPSKQLRKDPRTGHCSGTNPLSAHRAPHESERLQTNLELTRYEPPLHKPDEQRRLSLRRPSCRVLDLNILCNWRIQHDPVHAVCAHQEARC